MSLLSETVAVCCSMMQCVAVCCSEIWCVAVCGPHVFIIRDSYSVLQYDVVCCSVLQREIVCCSVYAACLYHQRQLQCVAV